MTIPTPVVKTTLLVWCHQSSTKMTATTLTKTLNIPSCHDSQTLKQLHPLPRTRTRVMAINRFHLFSSAPSPNSSNKRVTFDITNECAESHYKRVLEYSTIFRHIATQGTYLAWRYVLHPTLKSQNIVMMHSLLWTISMKGQDQPRANASWTKFERWQPNNSSWCWFKSDSSEHQKQVRTSIILKLYHFRWKNHQ